MKFELCSNFPWAWQHESSNRGSAWLLGTNYVSVQSFPCCLLLPIICYSTQNSCHPISLPPSKVISVPMISFCLLPSLQWAADPTQKHLSSLWESSVNPKQPLCDPWGHTQRLLTQAGTWCGHRARMRQFALELPAQSREYYLLVRTPDWETVSTAQILPLVFL